MGSKLKVVITDHRFANIEIQQKVLSEIEAQLVVGQAKSEDEIIEISRDAHGILVARSNISAKIIHALENCKVMVRYGVGVDNIDVPAATQKGIMVSNVLDYCVDEVADHALALILSLARKIVFSARRVQAGEWTIQNLKPLKRLCGQTVGVVGYGRIGKLLAKKASAVGFKVLAHDPFVGAAGSEADAVTFVPLETILRESDFVSLHTPLTEDTAGMIAKKQLDRMKDSACLVNVSRGALVDEAALIAALEENRIAGAGLDVLVEESANPDHPLQKMEQVIVTSHTAFYSEEAIQDLQRKAAQKVVTALSGQIPEPLVNPEVLKIIQK
jgi:D-3-phosphoglycerate dehydrogenase